MYNSKFAVISDLHYFSKQLTDEKRAYQLRSGSDQKCLLESSAIIDKAFKLLSADSTIDYVLICGDLTNNGELCSHIELRDKLIKLSKFKKIFLITATHDYCSGKNAMTFFGDKAEHTSETADIRTLRTLYDEFGFNDAVSVYEIGNGLCSYVTMLGEGVRLFALIDDQNGQGKSGYDNNHLEWIISQMKEAKKQGDRIIVMEHHLVLKHYTELLTKAGLSIFDRENIAETFAENGTDIVFVGHSHMQNITKYISSSNRKMVQVNVGSLVGYPSPIFKVMIDDEYISMRTEYLRSFDYKNKTLDTSYLCDHLKNMILNVIHSARKGEKAEFKERLEALGVKNVIIDKLFFIEKKLAEYVNAVNVGNFAKLINKLTFGKGINKQSAEEIAEKLVLEIALNIFTNLFDGGFHKYKKSSAEYTVVSDFVSLPSRILKHIPFIPEKITALTDEIHELICLLMDDPQENNYLRYSIR